MGLTAEIYRDVNKEYRFRIKAANGEIIATGESYKNKKDCEVAIELLQLHDITVIGVN